MHQTMTTTTIELCHGQVAIVDAEDLPLLSKYKWRALKRRRAWYARSDKDAQGRRRSVSMSRLIAGTQPDQVCHHRDRNSLNNSKANLISLSHAEHRKLHKDNNLLMQFEIAPRGSKCQKTNKI